MSGSGGQKVERGDSASQGGEVLQATIRRSRNEAFTLFSKSK
jgi:hypothetical protein